jgi:hypothetical protein
VAALLLLAYLVLGCSKSDRTSLAVSKDCYFVEINPGKFVPVKFSKYFDRDMTIKYGDQVVRYKGHVEANPPDSLMEFSGKLYVLALDATAVQRARWRWRCYEQDGDHFKEIPAKDFPRSVAIRNLWRPGDPRRHSVGMRGEKIDAVLLNRTLNPEDKYFVNSYQAMLWYMLEVTNSLDFAEKYFYGEKAVEFLRDYIAKYKPVHLTVMEMKPVPVAESKF